jgi:hypothetical protein
MKITKKQIENINKQMEYINDIRKEITYNDKAILNLADENKMDEVANTLTAFKFFLIASYEEKK